MVAVPLMATWTQGNAALPSRIVSVGAASDLPVGSCGDDSDARKLKNGVESQAHEGHADQLIHMVKGRRPSDDEADQESQAA